MVACHDAVDDGQPQPGAGALFLGGKKRVENSFEHFAAHPVAGVADGQPHIRPCLQVPGSALRLPVDFHLIEDDLQQPPLGSHRMRGIGAKIHEDLMNLNRVSQDETLSARKHLADFKVCRKR